VPLPIPATEPDVIVAGETVAWTKSFPDFPATAGWTLKYSLQLPRSSLITITATADGDNYSVALPFSTTASYQPGNYIWTAYVDNGTERHRVATGTISVLPNLASSFGETHASRTLGIIEAAIEGRLPNGLQEFSIQGQQISKIPIDTLVKLRSIYADYVKNETAQDRINRGLSNPRNSFARFRRPGSGRLGGRGGGCGPFWQ